MDPLISFCSSIQIRFRPEWSDPNHNVTFIMSIDGTHTRIYEPIHPLWSKNPEYYSHKFNQSALNYEIGLSLFTSDLAWVNGPFPASRHDKTIFTDDGLLDALPAGKKLVGDKGYRGMPVVVSTPNPFDADELREFKRRARARHETFNARLKVFGCLNDRFRHRLEKHKTVFEAVCVIIQFQMENGSPLFPI
jgi:hypothetical protein